MPAAAPEPALTGAVVRPGRASAWASSGVMELGGGAAGWQHDSGGRTTDNYVT